MIGKNRQSIKVFRDSGKNLHKKWIWIASVLIFAILVAIPFVINYAYMEGLKLEEPNTAFSASDLLSLYATILVALFSTISFTAYPLVNY